MAKERSARAQVAEMEKQAQKLGQLIAKLKVTISEEEETQSNPEIETASPEEIERQQREDLA